MHGGGSGGLTLKAKLRRCQDNGREYPMVWIRCPACEEHHAVKITSDGWTFNGDEERPTFTPSILVRGTKQITDEQAERICVAKK